MISPSADAIISCARSWMGTRFSHQGRLKKTSEHYGGVDCLGLLIGVALELDLKDKHGRKIASLDNTQYARLPDTKILYQSLADSLHITCKKNIKAGDILLLNIQESPQHLAIATQYSPSELGIIHSYAQARRVVEHAFDAHWQTQLVASFSIFEESKNLYENISE